MPVLGQDDFAGTASANLTTSTPEVGTSWSYSTGSGVLLNGGGGIFPSTTSTKVAILAPNPSVDDYSVQVTINVKSVIATENFGVVARTAIWGYYDRSNAGYGIVDTGGPSGFTASAAPSDGDVIKLTVTGTTAVLTVNGVVKHTLTGLATTSGGRPGIYLATTPPASLTTGTHLTGFNASTPSSPPPVWRGRQYLPFLGR